MFTSNPKPIRISVRNHKKSNKKGNEGEKDEAKEITCATTQCEKCPSLSTKRSIFHVNIVRKIHCEVGRNLIMLPLERGLFNLDGYKF